MSSIQRQHPRRAIECSPAVQFRILLWLVRPKCFSKHRDFRQTDSNGKNTWKTENPSFHPFHRFPEMCRSNRCHPVGRATSEVSLFTLPVPIHLIPAVVVYGFVSGVSKAHVKSNLDISWCNRMQSCSHAIMIHARFWWFLALKNSQKWSWASCKGQIHERQAPWTHEASIPARGYHAGLCSIKTCTQGSQGIINFMWIQMRFIKNYIYLTLFVLYRMNDLIVHWFI